MNYGNYRKPIEIEARENGRTKHHRKKTKNNEKKRTQELGYKPPQNPLKMLPNKRPSGGSSWLYVSPVPKSFGLKQRTQEDQPNRAKKNSGTDPMAGRSGENLRTRNSFSPLQFDQERGSRGASGSERAMPMRVHCSGASTGLPVWLGGREGKGREGKGRISRKKQWKRGADM